MELTSKALFEKSLNLSPGGVHSPVRSFKGLGDTPLFFKKGEGCYLTSVEGNRYIDFCMSFGPLILGHRHPQVQEKVEQMIDTLWTVGACEPYSLELSEWIQNKIPFVQKMRFVSSGTEAVMSALRVAKAATGRRKILKFEGCYHGHVDGMLVKAGSGLAGLAASSSLGVSEETAKETLVCALDSESQVEEVFSRHGHDIAAVIIEPLPANFGLLPQRREYLKFLRDITSENNSLLIFDEVISGFRLSLGGMASQLDIEPDLVTYGKIIGGGFPVGCYGGRHDLMDLVAPEGGVYQAGTLSANPIGMVAGLETLKILDENNVYETLEGRLFNFKSKIDKLFEAKSLPFQMVSQGSLFWMTEKSEYPIRSIDQISKKQSVFFTALFKELLKENLYLAPNAYEVGFLSLAHDSLILDESVKIFEKAIDRVSKTFSENI